MERLTGKALKREQERTMATPRMRYGLLARALFVGMDLVYRRAGLARQAALRMRGRA